MEEKLRALCQEYDMLPRDSLILCAVSGGMDSMCLLHLLHSMSAQGGFRLAAAHFNHQLRGAESDRDEAFVRRWCAEQEIPFFCERGDVGAEAALTGRGIEETARALRYAFLEDTARRQGASRIATAHTADDNAETMLLHLVRGSGLQGLTGIPPRRGDVVRPLLAVTRAEVEEYCAGHGVPHVEDSSNTDEGYTRNFLRRQVLPLLKQINPRTVENLSAAAARLRADNDYLNARAQQAAALARLTPDGLIVDAQVLAGLPNPVAVRAARRMLELAGGGKNCTSAQLSALLRLSRSKDPSGLIMLPDLAVQRVYGQLVMAPRQEQQAPPLPTPLNTSGCTVYGATGWTITCRQSVLTEKTPKKDDTFFFSCGKIKGTPVVRPRRTGDAVKLPGRGTKTLKKLLIDEKIPLADRAFIPVLADDDGVLAVAGFGPDVTRLAQPGEEAYEITIEKE